MTARNALAPKKPKNLYVTTAIGGVLLLIYLLAAWWRPWSPKEGLGLLFGFLGTLAFVFEMIYPVRRPNAWPLRSARDWMQAHVYLGGLTLLLVLIHTGFSLPHGPMGWALFLLSFWVTLSGVIGVFLQKWIPAVLARNTRVEALFERIPELVKGLRDEADELMADASDTLDNFYRTQVRNPLGTLNPTWAYVLDVREGREQALEPFRRIHQFVDTDEQSRVDDLMHIYTEKLELDAQYRMQWILRRWLTLTVHVVGGGVLVGLLAMHILTWILY
jgi:hypothetical protein